MSKTVEELLQQIDRLIFLVEENVKQNSKLMDLIDIIIKNVKYRKDERD